MRDCSIKALELEESSLDELFCERLEMQAEGVRFQCSQLNAFWVRLVAFGLGYSGSELEASADGPSPDVGISVQFGC